MRSWCLWVKGCFQLWMEMKDGAPSALPTPQVFWKLWSNSARLLRMTCLLVVASPLTCCPAKVMTWRLWSALAGNGPAFAQKLKSNAPACLHFCSKLSTVPCWKSIFCVYWICESSKPTNKSYHILIAFQHILGMHLQASTVSPNKPMRLRWCALWPSSLSFSLLTRRTSWLLCNKLLLPGLLAALTWRQLVTLLEILVVGEPFPCWCFCNP